MTTEPDHGGNPHYDGVVDGLSPVNEDYFGSSRQGITNESEAKELLEAGLNPDRGRGVTITVFSGKPFPVLAPHRDDIDIADIAHALSNLCRYTGHCLRFYSVAEHSWLTSYLVPERYALEALLHDAAEAYTGDMSRPVKVALRRAGVHIFDTIGARIDMAVTQRFNLDWSPEATVEVKAADNMALSIECRDIMRPEEQWQNLPDPSPEFSVSGLNPRVAKERFMERFNQLVQTGSYLGLDA